MTLKCTLIRKYFPNLQTIASTKQPKSKLVRNAFAKFKQQLEYGDIKSFSWPNRIKAFTHTDDGDDAYIIIVE